ncbi:MAG: hypothetical protein UT49_C0002G0016 [Parcubacteria group bacterium GW2011_GWF1_39_37]|nr:MAG: hypothetical protein UT49_C0002G0016 [Parcubacteria group bacterium GW2011_GWF1_39_37]KKR52143.1 MAG: hypothetical protein UT89_C0003G0079 [Parcubacteria group bacterium GW2011_GWE1_40_20]
MSKVLCPKHPAAKARRRELERQARERFLQRNNLKDPQSFLNKGVTTPRKT